MEGNLQTIPHEKLVCMNDLAEAAGYVVDVASLCTSHTNAKCSPNNMKGTWMLHDMPLKCVPGKITRNMKKA